MICGLFLRNFKNYENINFIPFLTSGSDRMTIFAGDNGAGKSAILESIDCLMNNVDSREWAYSIGQKKDRVNIFPLFIIKKSEWLGDDIQQMERISHYFWNFNFLEVSNTEFTKKYITYRDSLRDWYSPDDYFLISIGKNFDGAVLLTSTFHKKITDATKKDGVSKDKITSIFKRILDRYKFVYIPVENKTSDILSLQAYEMQGMMDREISDEIRMLLSNKEHNLSEDHPLNKGKGKTKKHSVIDIINSKLDLYIDEINKKIPEGYKFEYKGAIKRPIKPTDILDSIFLRYFTFRPLSKDSKNIKNLSSGEQRIALIDVATALLSTESPKNKEVILAIDEPEVSLEPAHRFEQFCSLINLSERYGRQIFITTHWYGLVLRPMHASLHYISRGEANNNVVIDAFPLQNIQEGRRAFPNSIEIKSYFDLMASMLSLLKKNEYNWIFCEGSEDCLYLNSYLKDSIPNLFILPFNGCGNIKKIFEFLHVPFSDEQENKLIKGKVLCLIDTDTKNLIRMEGYNHGRYNRKLGFFRLSIRNDESNLISIASTDATNTEIEDLLDPELFYSSLEKISKDDSILQGFMRLYEFKKGVKFTNISNGMEFLSKKTKDSYERMKEFHEYITTDRMKKIIADEYNRDPGKVVIRSEDLWVNKIKCFFVNS
ncbi:AAA family ATPase [Serratia sp. JUb9]|nr:AAA family ATPase [Serratia sp. JUb9]